MSSFLGKVVLRIDSREQLPNFSTYRCCCCIEGTWNHVFHTPPRVGKHKPVPFGGVAEWIVMNGECQQNVLTLRVLGECMAHGRLGLKRQATSRKRNHSTGFEVFGVRGNVGVSGIEGRRPWKIKDIVIPRCRDC